MFDIEKLQNDSPERLDNPMKQMIAELAIALIDHALVNFEGGYDGIRAATGFIDGDDGAAFIRHYFNEPELGGYDSSVKMSARVHQDTVRLAIGSWDNVLVDPATGPVLSSDGRIILDDTNSDGSPSFVEYIPLAQAKAIVASRLKMDQ